MLNTKFTSRSVSPAFPPTICGPPPVKRKMRLKLLKLKAKDEIRIGIIAGRTSGKVRLKKSTTLLLPSIALAS